MIEKVIFLGGNVFKEDGPVLEFAKICKKLKIDTFLFTNKIRIDYPTRSYGSFRDGLKKIKINYKVIKNFGEKEIFEIKKMIIKDKTAIISLNADWIFKKNFLSKNRVYNFHNASLPLQRGGACHSWRIMMNNFSTSLTFHLISNKIDAGDIIYSKKINVPKYCLNPSDYYKHIKKASNLSFEAFLKIINKKKIKKIRQNNSKSFYWPRLKTEKNGYIDWSWSAENILSFINAFSDPFIGATTFYEKNKVYLKNVKIVDKKTNFHPYQAGLIYRVKKNKIYISTISGGIECSYRTLKGKKLKVGNRFHTDLKSIFLSRNLS